jgi:hypothetical protein
MYGVLTLGEMIAVTVGIFLLVVVVVVVGAWIAKKLYPEAAQVTLPQQNQPAQAAAVSATNSTAARRVYESAGEVDSVVRTSGGPQADAAAGRDAVIIVDLD